MGSSYYITYGGDRLTFSGTTGSVAWKDTNQVRTLTLSAGANGSISADTLTGYDGDVVTLSTTPSAHHHFSAYSITGATLTGNQFAFSGSDVTAKASFDVDRYKIIFGEGNMYSAGLTATYNGTTVYSREVGSAQATATGIPYGAKITFCGSSPKYYCFAASSFTGLSGTSTVYNGSSRDGVGTTSTAYITADASARLSNGHQKTIRVEGDFPSVPGAYRYATIYCKVTAMSSWVGSSLRAGSAWLRSNMTGSYKCLKSNSWGAGNSTTVTTWLGRNCSAHTWSGYCNTTGNSYYSCSGYLERAAGFVTFGNSGKGYGKITAAGSVSNQTGGYFARGCMTNNAGVDCASAVAGSFWVTAYAP